MLVQFFPWPPKENSSPERLERTHWYRVLPAIADTNDSNLVDVQYPSGKTVKAKIISHNPMQAVQLEDTRANTITGIQVPPDAKHLGRKT